MKFLLDENVDARLVPYLAAEGHDVTQLVSDYPAGLSDDQVLSIAQLESRILITNDKDLGKNTGLASGPLESAAHLPDLHRSWGDKWLERSHGEELPAQSINVRCRFPRGASHELVGRPGDRLRLTHQMKSETPHHSARRTGGRARNTAARDVIELIAGVGARRDAPARPPLAQWLCASL